MTFIKQHGLHLSLVCFDHFHYFFIHFMEDGMYNKEQSCQIHQIYEAFCFTCSFGRDFFDTFLKLVNIYVLRKQ